MSHLTLHTNFKPYTQNNKTSYNKVYSKDVQLEKISDMNINRKYVNRKNKEKLLDCDKLIA